MRVAQRFQIGQDRGVSNAPTSPEAPPRVPTWTLGDRLAKARRAAKHSVADAVEYFEISAKTVNNYERDRTTPSRAVVLQWALWSGFDAGWLMTGVEPKQGPDTPGEQGGTQTAWNANVTPIRRSTAGNDRYQGQKEAA